MSPKVIVHQKINFKCMAFNALMAFIALVAFIALIL